MTKADGVLEASFERRAEAWARWGALEDDVLAHLINPSLMGGPRWPAMRQAFRVARREPAVLVASDGLSDPFDDDTGPDNLNGFGLEIFAISADPIDRVLGSWIFDLVWQMSQFAAQRGDIAEMISKLGVVTTELYDVNIPDAHRARFVNADGRVGVLVGVSDDAIPRAIDGPLSQIQLVGIKLLTLAELAFAVERGESGRTALTQRFELAKPSAASSLFRESVIPMG